MCMVINIKEVLGQLDEIFYEPLKEEHQDGDLRKP
jgi:hypothetical protein